MEFVLKVPSIRWDVFVPIIQIRTGFPFAEALGKASSSRPSPFSACPGKLIWLQWRHSERLQVAAAATVFNSSQFPIPVERISEKLKVWSCWLTQNAGTEGIFNGGGGQGKPQQWALAAAQRYQVLMPVLPQRLNWAPHQMMPALHTQQNIHHYLRWEIDFCPV